MTRPSPEQLSAAAKQELWRRGILYHKLDSTQQELYDSIFQCARMQYVLECARKLGKSYLLGCVALEACIRNPGKRVNWCLPTSKMAAETAAPILEEISADAPKEVRGEYSRMDGHWKLPNGSYIVLFGAKDEKDADRGRGPQAILSLIDEGAFFPSHILPYVLRSVIMPQHLRTGGKIVLASTPPVGMGHSWIKIASAAELNLAYAHRTVWQNGSLSHEQIAAMLSETAAAAGLTLEQYQTTAEYKREYLAQRVIDETSAVIPEFAPAESEIVKEFEPPEHFDAYVGIDVGYAVHASAAVYAVSDFLEQRLLVLDESWLLRANTRTLAEELKRVELKTWPGRTPLARVIDDTGRLVADLWDQHKIQTVAAQKGLDQDIALLRNLVLGRRLWIHPRCERLIRQMRTATWNNTGKVMEESTEDLHFDLIPALYMLARVYWANRMHNPYPAVEPKQGQYMHRVPIKAGPLAQHILNKTPVGQRLLRSGRR